MPLSTKRGYHDVTRILLFWVNSVLNSVLGDFNHSQNASVGVMKKILKKNSSGSANHKNFRITIRSGKMLTYPSPKPTLTLTETLAKCWLRGGVGVQNPEKYNDFCKHSIRTWKRRPNFFKLHFMSILAIRCNRRQNKVFLMPKYSL